MPVTTSLLTVGEIIDAAFGNLEGNRVNFKLLQTLLTLLARQLRLLNRKVALESDSPIQTSASNLIVSEVKIKKHTKKTNARPSSGKKSAIQKVRDFNLQNKAPSTMSKEFVHTTVWSSGENTPREPSTVERPSIRSDTTIQRQQKYHLLLEKIEEQREKVLRVIHQRKNSRDEGILTPSPMLSLESTEVEVEKMFIVKNYNEDPDPLTRNLPIVTQTQFNELVQMVLELRSKTETGDIYKTPNFPENMELMQELRSGASLTDAMSVLQIAARLEATETGLRKLSSLVAEIARGDNRGNKQQKKDLQIDQTMQAKSESTETEDKWNSSPSYVTKEELKSAMHEKQKEIMKDLQKVITRTNIVIENNTSQARKLELKIADMVNLQDRLWEVENMLTSYGHQLNLLDTGLTSQMSHVQETLQQAQLELEEGLMDMSTTLANKGVDTDMISDLNSNFLNLQAEIEKSRINHSELNDIQKRIAAEIKNLKYDMELLRDTKCDREEVKDALRDKAGIKDLNGMLTIAEHVATFADVKKNIDDAFKTFIQQELIWQKAIDDIFKHIEKKVDRIHVERLREDINTHLNQLNHQIHHIKIKLGEPLAASVSKKILRDTACLSCANPAHMMPLEDAGPALPPIRPSALGDKAPELKGDGDHVHQCIPGFKAVYPKENRDEICTRYCGGAHTKVRGAPVNKPTDLNVHGVPLLKPDTRVTDAFGSDGKPYRVEEEIRVPCIPCNSRNFASGEGTLEGLVISPMRPSQLLQNLSGPSPIDQLTPRNVSQSGSANTAQFSIIESRNRSIV